jgi:hypothetical protein
VFHASVSRRWYHSENAYPGRSSEVNATLSQFLEAVDVIGKLRDSHRVLLSEFRVTRFPESFPVKDLESNRALLQSCTAARSSCESEMKVHSLLCCDVVVVTCASRC